MEIIVDDCQLVIIKQLKLLDQLALYEAFREQTEARINVNICEYWRKQLTFQLNEEQFYIFDKKPELLHDFLCVISANVCDLKLDDVTVNRLRLWQRYEYPKLKTLEYSVLKHIEFNAVIELISETFTELNDLKAFGTVDLKHFANFRHLRKLDCSFNCFLASKTDESIQGIQGLQKLEELAIRSQKLSEDHVKKLAFLPKLRTFAIRNVAQYLSLIIDMRLKDIKKVTYCLGFVSHFDCIAKLRNLREIILMNTRFLDGGHLRKMLFNLPQLERLYIHGSSLSLTQSDCLLINARCPALQIFNTTPAWSLIEGNIQYYDSVPLDIKIIFDELLLDYSNKHMVKFEFYPQAD